MINPCLSQKIEAINFPAELTFLNFLEGVSQGVSIVCLAFLTLGRSGESMPHLGLQLAWEKSPESSS